MPESNPAPQVLSLFVPGPAGRLEALLNTGSAHASHAAVVCHPHPLYGGTMHNKVVYHIMKALNHFGFPVLRFNFRGAGLSHGQHDFGAGEVGDVHAALQWLHQEFSLPVIFAGFSFGAAVGLKASCPDPRVVALISVGTPLLVENRSYDYELLSGCKKPKLLVSGGQDEFAPRTTLERLAVSLPEPKRLVIIDEADHFLTGHLDSLQQVITGWVTETVESRSPRPEERP